MMSSDIRRRMEHPAERLRRGCVFRMEVLR